MTAKRYELTGKDYYCVTLLGSATAGSPWSDFAAQLLRLIRLIYYFFVVEYGQMNCSSDCIEASVRITSRAFDRLA